MPAYVIRQGDYLTKLAHRMGFDAEAVWNHDDNRALRERRPNREILHPGDVLHLPEPTAATGVDLTHESSNTYKARVPMVNVRVVLHNAEGHALAGKAFTVEGAGAPIPGTTEGDGLAAFEVPLHTREIRLTLDEMGQSYRLLVGDMDPVSELAGVWKRLRHLGHFSPYGAPPTNEHDGGLRRAVRAFQAARGLEVTGQADQATRDALMDAHGS